MSNPIGRGRLTIRLNSRYLNAPEVAFYGATEDDRRTFEYKTASAGAVARVQASRHFAFGGAFDLVKADAGSPFGTLAPRVDPTYGQARAFAEVDTRATPGYTTRGGYYRLDFTDYRETGGVTFPRSIEIGARGRPQRMRIVVESVELNPKLDEARFTLPR